MYDVMHLAGWPWAKGSGQRATGIRHGFKMFGGAPALYSHRIVSQSMDQGVRLDRIIHSPRHIRIVYEISCPEYYLK